MGRGTLKDLVTRAAAAWVSSCPPLPVPVFSPAAMLRRLTCAGASRERPGPLAPDWVSIAEPNKRPEEERRESE